jgi:hypothetical protein
MPEDVKYRPVPKGYKGIFRVRPDMIESKNVFHEAYGITGKGIIEDIDYLEGQGEFTGNPDHSIKVIFYRTYEDLKNRENMMLGWPVDVREYLLYPVSIKKNNYW